MREAVRIYRDRKKQDNLCPRGSLFYQSGFRSDREALTFLALPVMAVLIAWNLLAAVFGRSLLAMGLILLLLAGRAGIGAFAWIVWGRDAFPLSDKVQPTETSANLHDNADLQDNTEIST